ncbi:small acid-soluble spore protein Tlp [Pseudogracilibacillus auburnensis]|uniref:Small, acid-soluble spore protein Tlp n=1 Tax=Pseudogracilibacillus auburnensis TaxID=1494959 RepID=A0A2V3VYX4_9BACI|nr:small acid-soluble spore protein Tlp [Pseudogracilibacillus auburnensis]MBO1004602.1 small acid-soluble spore protein Tlp [Pseudogracilibacillus auburnensis]PXW85155.1 small acid-soluble spore protein (thioredoxin-like protein) [Pseudogracilibacillus auburnensis]
MDKNNNKPKPDDRSDNVEKLQHMVHDTIENMREAEDRMEWATNHEKEKIEAKNKRREEAIEGFREEIEDEYEDQNH